MLQKIFLLAALFTAALHQSAAQAPEPRTLSDCISLAINNNLTLKRASLNPRRGEVQYRQAWQERLPAVQAGLEHGLSQGRSIDPTTNQFIEENIVTGSQSLSSSVNVFEGFHGLYTIRMKAAALQASKLETQAAQEELKLEVIEAYIALLTAQDLLQSANSLLEVTRAQLERAEVLQNLGEYSPSDYYDIKGQHKTDLNALLAAQQQVHHSRLRLSGLLYIPLEELGEIAPIRATPRVPAETGLSTFISMQSELPAIKAWTYREQEGAREVQRARSGYFPAVSLGAGIASRYSDANPLAYSEQLRNNLGKYLSVSLRIPIFNRFMVRNQVAQAKIDLQDVKWQGEIARQQLSEKAQQAVFDLKAAYEMVENLKEQTQYYQEAFRIAQVQFDLGVSNSVLYLSAKSKLDVAEKQLVVRTYEWLLQKYINDYYAGELDY